MIRTSTFPTRWFPGMASRAVTATIEARWKIFTSDYIVAEVRRTLSQKFQSRKAFINSTIADISRFSHFVEEAVSRHRVAGDPGDTPILRAALAAGVDYLITGDGELLAMNPQESVRIISLAEYLDLLRNYGIIQKSKCTQFPVCISHQLSNRLCA